MDQVILAACYTYLIGASILLRWLTLEGKIK